MKKTKLLGTLAIIPTILLILWIVVFSIFGTLFGVGSGVSVVNMMPFLSISIFQLIILIFSFYFSLKLLRDQTLPIKENNTVAYTFIAIGVIYFIYNFATVLYNNITDFNPGGEMQPVLS
ncbi:MAG: hypothetical protein COX29_02585 [Candidatus Moranbacteria bacterium CG23_combo_of_CG06-09_8_20_14_all_35_22]|nr:MAG: hypothetical protein COX29_02585 [Candidatus Moranbacteria bacterium CG23_combo_of_CG06-09_8_20_14_all_35_22]